MIPQEIKDKIEVEYPDNHYTGVTNEEMGNLRKAAEHGYELAMEQNKSLMDENKELKERVENYEFQINTFIDWLQEHRPNVSGLGAPIHILKSLLNKP